MCLDFRTITDDSIANKDCENRRGMIAADFHGYGDSNVHKLVN